jgi:hypothetical protein
MKIIKTIELPEDIMNYVQFLHFNKESYKEIMSHILLLRSKREYEFSKENYEYFMDEYREAHMKFNQMFNSLLKDYAPEYYGNNDYRVTFDFDELTMNISQIKGDNND